jgi:hypothetical protein
MYIYHIFFILYASCKGPSPHHKSSLTVHQVGDPLVHSCLVVVFALESLQVASPPCWDSEGTGSQYLSAAPLGVGGCGTCGLSTCTTGACTALLHPWLLPLCRIPHHLHVSLQAREAQPLALGIHPVHEEGA